MPPRPPRPAGANDAAAAAADVQPASAARRNAGTRLRGRVERAGGHVAALENAGGRRPLSVQRAERRHLELIRAARSSRARSPVLIEPLLASGLGAATAAALGRLGGRRRGGGGRRVVSGREASRPEAAAGATSPSR